MNTIDKLYYMIQVHRLEGFYWVARTGGYARAARAFPYPITQPAVHQQVRKLEGELGTRLFERVGKSRMRMTPAARHLYAFIGPFFDGLPAVVRSVRTGEHGGEVRIQAASLLLRQLLPAWVRRLRRRAPDVQVSLTETVSNDVQALRSHAADLIVTHLPQIPADIETRRVGTLHGFVVVPRGHTLAGRARVSLRDLQGETFISYSPGLLAYDIQMRALAESGVTPERTLSATTAQTILALVEADLGVSAFATPDPSGPRGRGFVALRIERPRVELPIVMAWRRHGPRNPALEAALATAPPLTG